MNDKSLYVLTMELLVCWSTANFCCDVKLDTKHAYGVLFRLVSMLFRAQFYITAEVTGLYDNRSHKMSHIGFLNIENPQAVVVVGVV